MKESEKRRQPQCTSGCHTPLSREKTTRLCNEITKTFCSVLSIERMKGKFRVDGRKKKAREREREGDGEAPFAHHRFPDHIFRGKAVGLRTVCKGLMWSGRAICASY